LHPVQLVSIVMLPGEMEKLPLEALTPEALMDAIPPPQPASASTAGSASASIARTSARAGERRVRPGRLCCRECPCFSPDCFWVSDSEGSSKCSAPSWPIADIGFARATHFRHQDATFPTHNLCRNVGLDRGPAIKVALLRGGAPLEIGPNRGPAPQILPVLSISMMISNLSE